jgi:quinol monooxygenase YgiN
MSDPVLIGFAGVLVAAVTAGALGGRCVRRPLAGLAVWTAAALALTVALAVQAQGLSRGFSPATFRAAELSGLLLAPLWLAWGLVELAAGEAARFGVRLAFAALSVVAGVILATDPLSARPFGMSWPLPGLHYRTAGRDALALAQAVAVIAAVAALGLAARRPRAGRGRLGAMAAVALAVLLAVAPRFSLPVRSLYPLLGTVAAALVWFGAIRLAGLPAAARDMAGGDGPPGVAPGDYAAAAPGDYAAAGPGEDGAAAALGGRRAAGGGLRPPPPHWRGGPGAAVGPARTGVPGGGPPGRGRPAAPGGARGPGDPAAAAGPRGLPGPAPAAATAAGPAGAAAGRPYGRILIFTLLDDKAAEFDRLAEQTAEQVRLFEPGTLVYVIHLVPDAPLQRIFYEIYLDRKAFDSHESQPYMQRFVAERRPYVLATTVIELRLKYAKVAPLPDPQAASPGVPYSPHPPRPASGARPQLPAATAGRPQGPARAAGLEPLPPVPPRGQDQRRLPAARSAAGRHGGI